MKPLDCRWRDGRWRQGTIAQRTVWSDHVVLSPPSLDQDLGFRQRVEDLPVEQFIP